MPVTWTPVPDYRESHDGYPRGDAVDFFPLLPSPLTLSIVRGGWEVAARDLSRQVEVTLPPGWQTVDGQCWGNPAFWQRLATSLGVSGPGLRAVLGMDGVDGGERPRGGFGRFFRRRKGTNWVARLRAVADARDAVRRWHRRVLRQRWAQADILQVMEEIVPMLGRVLAGYAIATLALADAITPHLDGATPALPLPADLPSLGSRATATPAIWSAVQPFDVAAARRGEARAEKATDGHAAAIGQEARWHAALRAREEMRLALARVMDGARVWTEAAAHEGLQDGRLTAVEEVFLLDLEEVKQMMTGEWNDPARVQAAVARGREAWQQHTANLPPPPWSTTEVALVAASPLPEHEVAIAAAPGWHPGWAHWAARARSLATLARSPFSYGHLLARHLDIPIHTGTSPVRKDRGHER